MIQRFRPLLPLQFALLFIGSSSLAQEADVASDGPWISSAIWLSAEEVAGTKSQGLLLRPAEIVTAPVDNLADLTTVGQAEMSLWKLLSVNDGKLIATDYRGGIHLLGSEDPATIKTDSAKWIRALTATPDADKFLVGDEDGQLIEFSLSGREETRRIAAHSAAIFDIAFSPAGDKLATACGDGSLKLFRWPELEELAEMSRGSDSMWAVVFTQDGSQLVSGGGTDNRRIQLWDVASGNSICTICRTRDWISDLVRLPHTNLVIASCMDGKLVAADTVSRRRVDELEATESAIWSMDLSPDGTRLVLGTRKHGFQVVELPDWRSQAQAIAEKAAATRPPEPTSE